MQFVERYKKALAHWRHQFIKSFNNSKKEKIEKEIGEVTNEFEERQEQMADDFKEQWQENQELSEEQTEKFEQ